ncbi:diguanylate cyclase [Tissierella sp.]|uniref:sensor domain-containing diguanylate cyclase n=1 Tax=Tissierella sp. TaxID=41274 RepID=UPI0028AC11EC|nr:diguanylate cyclase [Tissierella sp.]
MVRKNNIDFLRDEEKLRLIAAIDQAAVSIIMTDIDGNIQYCNPAFEQTTGYSFEEVIGQNPRILKSGLISDEVFKDMWETIIGGQNWKGDLINKKKDGTIYYEEARITPIIDNEGKIVNFLGVKQDVSRRKYLEEKLKQTSIRDPLTNLYNRGYIFERLSQCLEIFKRNGEGFSLAIIDMDFFKDINDTYGHQAGDYVLKEFSEILTSGIRVYDIAGRYGGEEFILILHGIRKKTSAKIIKRILEEVRNSTFAYEDKEIKITFSCGICDVLEIDKGNLSIESLVCKADKRLYDAKNTGRNKIVID